MKAELIRGVSDDKQTLGDFRLFDEDCKMLFHCKTLELPWKENKVRQSCVPSGTYDVVFRTSARFSRHYHLTDVPGRTYILIHPGNYHSQIEGCILVGENLVDINGDGYLDVTSSRNTLNKLLMIAPKGFKLDIRWREEP